MRRKIGDLSGEASVRYWMARMSRYRKDYQTAKSNIEIAIGLIENIRGRAKTAKISANLISLPCTIIMDFI